MLSLVARGTGWRWPLRALEVWDDTTHEQVAEFDAALMLQIVTYFLHGAEIQTRVRDSRPIGPPMDAPPPPVLRKPLRAVNGRKLRGRAADGAPP